ncbi:MAG: hypothetical protein CSA84_05035 [Actinomycetales bacterium]|nr:MAG: hypothetical protein CSA84_05035 [Actinomycetales bacterium]
MPNRLASATSPYLRQHDQNPVDWWEWSPDAFEEARHRDVPVFLSIGYAACHWCHVMAHESFEDQQVADALARGFVAIKVDREERPDVDALYMAATLALNGQGGWPMTVLLTPVGEPFWAGTYLPRATLLHLLDAAEQAWTETRGQLVASSQQITAAMRISVAPHSPEPITRQALEETVPRLARIVDRAHGGFGRAPKFPPSMVLEFLLRHHARTGSGDALTIVDSTCEAMARGGIYDQLAGGFARYAVDPGWVVPHFEKMLYDNAQLARVYLHWWRATGSRLGERVARETCDFILTELGTDTGGFASSLDADTDGIEGLTYVWTPDELTAALGPVDGARAAELLSVTAKGTFEHGRSTLQLRSDPEDESWWASVRDRLRRVRDRRSQPARDDKVVTSWNGLAIAALAEAAVLLDEPRYLDAAIRAADYILDQHVVAGRLRRSSLGGMTGTPLAVADDHGNLAEGLLALHQATGDGGWLAAAGSLLDAVLDRYTDSDAGTAGNTADNADSASSADRADRAAGIVFDTPVDGETLVARPHSAADNAEPSGQSSVAAAMVTYAALTGSVRHADFADAALAVGGATAQRDPRFAGWTLAGAEARLTGPVQVAVVGSTTGSDGRIDADAEALARVARTSTSPGLVCVMGAPDTPGVPLLAGRPLVDGRAAAYVCEGFFCRQPVTTVAELRRALSGHESLS